MELKDLEKMKVDELRAEASKLEGVDGVKTMKKQELIDLLTEKLGVQSPEASSGEEPKGETAEETAAAPAPDQAEKPEPPEKPQEKEAAAPSEAEAKPEEKAPAAAAQEAKAEPKAAEKKPSPFKAPLKALQAKRKKALADRDYQTLADVRMRIKKYKRKIKKEASAPPSSS